VAVVAPAAMVTDEALVNIDGSVMETAAPPVGAAPDSATVQVVAEPEVTDVGEHWKLESVAEAPETVMEPPVPVTLTWLPSPMAPMMLLSERESLPVAVEGRVAVSTATTPPLMAVSFMPAATQVMEPAAGLQVSVLPAAVRDDPATALSEVTPLG